jgi:aryl-alcohol dehydrogenase-like predicted oxidoreductase
MTFGKQNTLAEGVEQLQLAHEKYGINFIDTAEMYPVPTEATTQGATDRTVAAFLKTVPRKSVVLATKVCGRSDRINWLPRRKKRTPAQVTPEQIMDSVDASLERLGVDQIDLLQIHWPDRYTGGLFGAADFTPSKYENAPKPNSFEEQLQGLQQVVKSGKVRYVGVSNETPYGVCSFANLAERYPDLYPKIVSIQNSYSLVVRKDFEAGLAEACYHHNVGLLAYSPLAAGTLTGKYRDPDHIPPNSRMLMFPGFMDRYLKSSADAVNAYCKLAESKGLTPAQLALAWCYHNPLVASTIIGATTMSQLTENLKSYDIKLDDDIQSEIAKLYKMYTDPTKSVN